MHRHGRQSRWQTAPHTRRSSGSASSRSAPSPPDLRRDTRRINGSSEIPCVCRNTGKADRGAAVATAVEDRARFRISIRPQPGSIENDRCLDIAVARRPFISDAAKHALYRSSTSCTEIEPRACDKARMLKFCSLRQIGDMDMTTPADVSHAISARGPSGAGSSFFVFVRARLAEILVAIGSWSAAREKKKQQRRDLAELAGLPEDLLQHLVRDMGTNRGDLALELGGPTAARPVSPRQIIRC